MLEDLFKALEPKPYAGHLFNLIQANPKKYEHVITLGNLYEYTFFYVLDNFNSLIYNDIRIEYYPYIKHKVLESIFKKCNFYEWETKLPLKTVT